jgi:hypothetical protein
MDEKHAVYVVNIILAAVTAGVEEAFRVKEDPLTDSQMQEVFASVKEAIGAISMPSEEDRSPS